jgi:hypothetical protein
MQSWYEKILGSLRKVIHVYLRISRYGSNHFVKRFPCDDQKEKKKEHMYLYYF